MEKQQLSKVFRLTNGKSISSDYSDLKNGEYIVPIYGGNSILGYAKKYLIDTKTLVIGRVGEYCGNVNLVDGKIWVSDNALYISEWLMECDVNYLFYVLTKVDINRFSDATGQPKITQSLLKRIHAFFPSEIAEQTAIATILSKVDEAIEATQNSIKAAEKLKKALMQNLLTGKLKPDGSWRTDDELQITKYGYAFKDWIYCKINDLIKEGYITKVQDGNHGESHPVSAEFVDEGIPFVMASDISKGYVDTENCKKITKERADKLRIGFSYKDDVLISHKASVGYTCIVDKAEPYIMLTPQVTLYRVDKQKLIPEYLLYFFQLYTFQIILEGNAKQSTRNYIGITNQKKMWIYLPETIEEQKELVAPIIKVDKEVIGKQMKIQILQRLKKSLMQNLLTGKVRLDVEKVNKILKEQVL